MAGLDNSIKRTNENIIRYVYRLVLLEAIIFGLLFISIQYPSLKTEKLQVTSSQYHLASVHYCSTIMEKITTFGKSLQSKRELKVNRSNNDLNTTEKNYQNIFDIQVAPFITKPIKALKVIQDQFKDEKFIKLLHVIDDEYAKLIQAVGAVTTADKQNVNDIQRALISFLNPIHRFNQLHEKAYSNDKHLIEQIKANHSGYLALVMVLLFLVGVRSCNTTFYLRLSSCCF